MSLPITAAPPSLPAGAWDCHMHVFDDRFPCAPNAVLTPPNAALVQYQALQQRLGWQHHLLIQPSSYGTDNRLLLHTLAQAGPAARGVAVIDTSTSAAEIAAMAAAGVVGTRFNLVQAGATRLDMLETVAQSIAEHGWHLELHAAPALLLEALPRLLRLPVPLVLDHWGRVASEPALEVATAQAIDTLLAAGRTWVKLSGPYLAAGARDWHTALSPHAARWSAQHPDRLLWGSDWPHATETDKPEAEALLALFTTLVPSAAVREQVLVHNPHQLLLGQQSQGCQARATNPEPRIQSH